MHKVVIVLTILLPQIVWAADTADYGEVVDILADECSDGLEHIVIHNPESGQITDATIGSDAEMVEPDWQAIQASCQEATFNLFHCHTGRNHPLHAFPSASFGTSDNDSSDFGFLIEVESRCAATAYRNRATTPAIRHFLVHTGGDNEVIEYGLSDEILGLVHQLVGADCVNATDPTVDPSVCAPKNRAPAGSNDPISGASMFESLISDAYETDLRTFLFAQCPDGVSATNQVCEGFNISAFASMIGVEGYYYVQPVNQPQQAAAVASVENTMPEKVSTLDISSYPAFVKIEGAEEYIAHSVSGPAIVVDCFTDTEQNAETCALLMEEAEAIAKNCSPTSVNLGVVEGNLYPDLTKYQMFPGEIRNQSMLKLIKGGERVRKGYTSRTDDKVYALILCGIPALNQFTGM